MTFDMKSADNGMSGTSYYRSLLWAFVFIALLSVVVFAGVWGITNALNAATP